MPQGVRGGTQASTNRAQGHTRWRLHMQLRVVERFVAETRMLSCRDGKF